MLKTIEDLKDLQGKRVLVRVDFNVPQTNGVIRDDNRIRAALPTINYLTSKGARVILMSHLGKIKWKEPDMAKIEAMKKANDLSCAATRLGELVSPTKVYFCKETRGEALANAVANLKDGEILLMQNTRYEKGEEKNNPELAAEWASLADVFVMDAFGSSHRAHASTVGVPSILKEEGKQVAEGYLMIKEVSNLTRCVEVKDEDRPYVAILGGFKVSDKIKVIDSLLKKCDYVLIGGAMTYTFKKAMGMDIGNSPCEMDQLDYARKCIDEANGRLILPDDAVVTDSFEEKEGRNIKVVDTEIEAGGRIPDGFEGCDIGPRTIARYQAIIAKAKMVFWNGPMGVFEQKDFQSGTVAVCKAIAELQGKAFTVCGGGDSASAVKQFGYKASFSHVSTGGGASLEMIENDGHLPGVDVLR
ncbi:MAG: phosphoglycerate kinase [Bacillales bacterium]|nr:phosphoglycerate kinase [Mollicutes bacterium]MCI7213480.1 phosphoglycerate kinase [Bacillales bacterium]MDY3904629.1 phosphoglycerate kinase [Candidatus Enteromonas sp.]MCI7058065.1 phosphoglycerate kinase [Mollicutes bacterium]MDD7714506.1 phosphoglycerate kinase [Mollicutes bacterium]